MQDHKGIILASLKCLGSFVCQACIVPIRSQNLYRDLVDQNIIALICQITQSASQG